MVGGWVLLYFCCHAIAHWVVGRVLGIRFASYTVGGTGNPEGWPAGLRWLFEHLPFFGVQTEKASMQKASPIARAIMWSAGVTSSAVVPSLGAFWAWRSGVPGSKLFLLFALFWAAGTLPSNWTSRAGDYAKARRALGNIWFSVPRAVLPNTLVPLGDESAGILLRGFPLQGGRACFL